MESINVWQILTIHPLVTNLICFGILLAAAREIATVITSGNKASVGFLVLLLIGLTLTSALYTQGRPLEALRTNPIGTLAVASLSLICFVVVGWIIGTRHGY